MLHNRLKNLETRKKIQRRRKRKKRPKPKKKELR